MGGKSTTSSKKSIRKGNDSLDLKPLSRMGTASSGGGSGTRNTNSEAVCIMAFSVELPQKIKFIESATLSLEQIGGFWEVIYRGEVVTRLKKERAEMLSRCSVEGYNYTGKVKFKGKIAYGEFRRSS
jgi:hypothetical protein